MSYVASAEPGPAGFVAESAALLQQVRGELSAPTQLPGAETSDDDFSRVSYTPIASRITSGDEAGDKLDSEATSLDPESSDEDAAANATADPYQSEAAVRDVGADTVFSMERIPKEELEGSTRRDPILAAIKRSGESSMASLAANARFQGKL
eukprot:15466784-Alexandrium_andersonii.AAC.1